MVRVLFILLVTFSTTYAAQNLSVKEFKRLGQAYRSGGEAAASKTRSALVGEEVDDLKYQQYMRYAEYRVAIETAYPDKGAQYEKELKNLKNSFQKVDFDQLEGDLLIGIIFERGLRNRDLIDYLEKRKLYNPDDNPKVFSGSRKPKPRSPILESLKNPAQKNRD